MWLRCNERNEFEKRQWEAALNGITLEEPEWNDEQSELEHKRSIQKFKDYIRWKAKKQAEGTYIDPRNIDALLKSDKGVIIGINSENEQKLQKKLKKQGVV
jgi:hypothetical protein